MDEVLSLIRSQVSALTTESQFKSWLEGAGADEPSEIVFNNSYIYRQNLKTNKNDLYLGCTLSGERVVDLTVYSGFSLNRDFTILSSKGTNVVRTDLREAVRSAISDLGMLLFLLIGTIDDSTPFEVPVNSRFITRLMLNPQSERTRFDKGTLVINDTTDEEALWDVATKALKSTPGFDESRDEIREKLGQAIVELDKKAYATLDIPGKGKMAGPGILGQLSEILDEQIREYGSSLESLEKDNSAVNNVLRIAYNFASDATTMMRLIISICDLKPIVLWCTLHSHFLLSEAFKSLPWTRSKYKASLKGYIDTIGDARNSAFHKLFPFRRALDVNLPEGSLRGPTLRIFSEFSRKSENELTYQDKELVGVLTEFTRVSTIKVSHGFWQKNLEVMKQTRELLRNTGNTLRLLHRLLP